MTDRIDPSTPSGFRDYLPEDAIAFQLLVDRIRQIFELFGFTPIDTPAMERVEVLTGGDPEFSKQLYRARITEDDEPLGMRFDLTVPLARYVAAHADKLNLPLARYHIGPVWRGEHTQAGRYRQFTQCDADIVGARGIDADAQIIAMVFTVMNALGLGEKTTIHISNRKVLDGLAEFLQFDTAKTPAVLRAIDKLDKHGWDSVSKELTDKIGLDAQQTDGIQEFLTLKATSPEALLDAAHSMLQFAPRSHIGIEELRTLISTLDALKVPRTVWQLDLGIARGLGYYTGTVFETLLAGSEQFGSVCSGGRYDDLVSRFSPLQLSGVGMSVGLDRLLVATDELGLTRRSPTHTRVLLLNFEPTCQSAVLALASQLRQASINTQVYLGNDDSLKGQLSWAVKSQIPYVVIMGTSEAARGVAQLKDMSARTQDEVPLAELAGRLQ